jgi:hypothetical protein
MAAIIEDNQDKFILIACDFNSDLIREEDMTTYLKTSLLNMN